MRAIRVVVLLVLSLSSLAAASPRLIEDTERVQLTERLTLLESERPTSRPGQRLLIGGGVALGLGLLAGAAGVGIVSSTSNILDTDRRVVGVVFGALLGCVGVAAMVAGVILLLVGMVKLLILGKQQTQSDTELKQVRDRLEQLDLERARLAPPPSVWRPAFEVSVVAATF